MRQLEYLTALDQERHFGRAAACHVSQPTLSAALSRLEDELGIPLVRRGRRFEGFTPEGERVLVWARRTLADADGLAQEVSGCAAGWRGRCGIGAIPTRSRRRPHHQRFRARHPRMRVGALAHVARDRGRPRAGKLDAGLTYLDNEPLENVRTLPLGASTTRHRRRTPAPPTISWAEAAELPLCLLTPDMQNRRIVDAAFAAAGRRARTP